MHKALHTKFLDKVCVWCFNMNFFFLWNVILLNPLFWGGLLVCLFGCI